jgi:aryl-alcohol dehydrogenase-like predicted oxidoreductase
LSNNEKLVIGTVQFGISYGIANVGGQVHSNEVLSILDFAFENNINTLDTAKIYGNSEKVIGDYLKTHPNYAWDVITKLSDIDVANQLKDSSKKLTIQPDVALAHSAELYLNKVFQVELKNVKEKQFVDKIGVSLYSKKEIIQVLNSSLKPDVVQLPMNILDSQLYRQGVLGKIFEKGIEIHVRSAFLQGLFYLSKTDLEARFKDVVPYLEKLKSISADSDLTLSELSLLWLVSLKEVSKVIIGVDNVNQLRTHLETLEKNVSPSVFEEALSICYENENILNPSLWPAKS